MCVYRYTIFIKSLSSVVKDGWINAEGYTPGDKVLIGCDPGFQISGVSVLGAILWEDI